MSKESYLKDISTWADSIERTLLRSDGFGSRDCEGRFENPGALILDDLLVRLREALKRSDVTVAENCKALLVESLRLLRQEAEILLSQGEGDVGGREDE